MFRTPANAQNGLCLNALHDKAFDKGLITLDDDLRVVSSKSLRDALTAEAYTAYFAHYEGARIHLPTRCPPSPAFLDYHRTHIFLS